jgi:hypothetical protein
LILAEKCHHRCVSSVTDPVISLVSVVKAAAEEETVGTGTAEIEETAAIVENGEGIAANEEIEETVVVTAAGTAVNEATIIPDGTSDATVRSVTNVTRLGILHVNARRKKRNATDAMVRKKNILFVLAHNLKLHVHFF